MVALTPNRREELAAMVLELQIESGSPLWADELVFGICLYRRPRADGEMEPRRHEFLSSTSLQRPIAFLLPDWTLSGVGANDRRYGPDRSGAEDVEMQAQPGRSIGLGGLRAPARDRCTGVFDDQGHGGSLK